MQGGRPWKNTLDRKTFSSLTPEARDILIRLHHNLGWDFPEGLLADDGAEDAPQEIVLWDKERPQRGAVQIFFSDPVIRQKPEQTLSRYSYAITHLTRILGSDTRVTDIWEPELRAYYAKRISEKAAPATVGWEISCLSSTFEVLIARRRSTGISENPCKHVRGGSKRDWTQIQEPAQTGSSFRFFRERRFNDCLQQKHEKSRCPVPAQELDSHIILFRDEAGRNDQPTQRTGLFEPKNDFLGRQVITTRETCNGQKLHSGWRGVLPLSCGVIDLCLRLSVLILVSSRIDP